MKTKEGKSKKQVDDNNRVKHKNDEHTKSNEIGTINCRNRKYETRKRTKQLQTKETGENKNTKLMNCSFQLH